MMTEEKVRKRKREKLRKKEDREEFWENTVCGGRRGKSKQQPGCE
jgi:hypothetical protein